jgi:hypothetical protein
MIFVGDIALPYKRVVKIESIPSGIISNKWYCNLEVKVVKGTTGVNR